MPSHACAVGLPLLEATREHPAAAVELSSLHKPRDHPQPADAADALASCLLAFNRAEC